jgi:hypothetical protein
MNSPFLVMYQSLGLSRSWTNETPSPSLISIKSQADLLSDMSPDLEFIRIEGEECLLEGKSVFEYILSFMTMRFFD